MPRSSTGSAKSGPRPRVIYRAGATTCCGMRVSSPEIGCRRRRIVWLTGTSIIASDWLYVPSPAPHAELLLALSQVLARLRVGWYVFGAQAVMHWGRPRLTEDIDVTVQLGSVETGRLVADLRQAGFELRVEGTAAFVAQTRVIPLTFGDSGWGLDVVLGGPGLEEEFVRRAVQVELAPGVTVPIISAEDLIVTKVLAGRPKDLDDVRGVLVAQAGRVDLTAARETLTMLEDALGVSDLIPVFERLVHP